MTWSIAALFVTALIGVGIGWLCRGLHEADKTVSRLIRESRPPYYAQDDQR